MLVKRTPKGYGFYMFADRAYFFDHGLRFECQQCGQCCTGESGTIYVGPEEIAAMAAHLGLPVGPFVETYLYPFRDSHSIREDDLGNCLFYDQGCTIYPVRPMQCSSFPFWFSNLRSEKRWQALRRECPGIGQGRLYTKQEILARVQRALRF
ncbi:MAG: YkgJ family cysteine cluster protein [Desulfobacterales bacterium]|nr:YkgJ family cysteine cluster protein [Desulfobacterales bacterium]